MKRFPLVLSIALSTLVLTSCSKDDDNDDDNSNCRITGATITTGATTQTSVIAYNENGKVSSVQSTSGGSTSISIFSYTGNVILINRATAGVVTSVDSIVLNSGGMLQYLRSRQVPSGSYTESVVTYNNGDQLSTVTSSSNGAPNGTQTGTYTNGNLTSLTDGSNLQTIDYDLTQGSQDGDYLRFTQLTQYGTLYIKNKNLLAKISSGATASTFTYNYDGDGKITGLQQVSGGNITTINYTYSCN